MKTLLILSFLSLPLSAATIADFDFSDDPNRPFGFSFGSTGNIVNFDRQAGSFAITQSSGATNGFAGGGFTSDSINLGVDPSFVAGSVTIADLRRLTVEFAVDAVSGTNIQNIRLQPQGGGFAERIDLAANVTDANDGTFTIDLADPSVSDTQLGLFANELNLNNELRTSFQISFGRRDPNQSGSSTFQVGDSAVFSQLTVTSVDAVPEPSSALTIGALLLAGLTTRRRS